jgi:hypothetical protein
MCVDGLDQMISFSFLPTHRSTHTYHLVLVAARSTCTHTHSGGAALICQSVHRPLCDDIHTDCIHIFPSSPSGGCCQAKQQTYIHTHAHNSNISKYPPIREINFIHPNTHTHTHTATMARLALSLLLVAAGGRSGSSSGGRGVQVCVYVCVCVCACVCM